MPSHYPQIPNVNSIFMDTCNLHRKQRSQYYMIGKDAITSNSNHWIITRSSKSRSTFLSFISSLLLSQLSKYFEHSGIISAIIYCVACSTSLSSCLIWVFDEELEPIGENVSEERGSLKRMSSSERNNLN